MNYISPPLEAAVASQRTESDVRALRHATVTMLDTIRAGVSKPKPQHRTCPFCGTEPPMAAQVCGRWVIACEASDCYADLQVAGTSVEQAWARWDARA